MAQHSNNKKNNKNSNKKNEKSAFKVDPARAQKAKKGKASVKFNKSKTQSMNRDLITKLNDSLTPLQMAVRSRQDVEESAATKQFVNPVREKFEETIRVDEDLDQAILKMSNVM